MQMSQYGGMACYKEAPVMRVREGASAQLADDLETRPDVTNKTRRENCRILASW